MKKVTIDIVKQFSPRPYGRFPSDGEGCGENFRKILAPILRNNRVHVILDGYNRYGRSFLDEAFGGLIRVENFTKDELQEKLTYSHSTVSSINQLISDRIEAAALAAGK